MVFKKSKAAARVVSLVVIVVAVLIGVVGRTKPELFLKIPRYGFIPWALTGNRMPPYFDPECWYKEHWTGQEGDIVISSGIKAGTLWLHNIVLLLRSSGWDDFDEMTDYYGNCELLKFPDDTLEMRLQEDAEKRKVARTKGFYGFQFFTHFSPGENPKLHGLEPAWNPKVKYIAIVRNGREVLKSAFHFINSVTDDFFAMWGGFPPKLGTSDDVVRLMVDDVPEFYFGHLLSWWERKDEPNVLLLHYRNMRQDPATVIQQIANFLEIPLGPDLLATVLHKSSLEYMSRPARINKYSVWVGYPHQRFTNVETDRHIVPGGGQLVDNDSDNDAFYTNKVSKKWKAALQKYFGHDPELMEFANKGVMPTKST